MKELTNTEIIKLCLQQILDMLETLSSRISKLENLDARVTNLEAGQREQRSGLPYS